MIIRGAFLDLQTSLTCGQAFRWKWMGNQYHGVVQGKVIILKAGSYETFQLKSSGPFDYHSYFRLDDDLEKIYGSFSGDPHMPTITRLYPGMRILRQEPFETLISYIISQVSNIPRITRTIETLSHRYGTRIRFNGEVYHSFPSAEQLSRVRESSFRKMGLGYRARYVRNAVQRVIDDSWDLDTLKKKSYDEAKTILMSLEGVGDKVADCVLLFSLDKLEAFPVDRWVRRIVKYLYFQDYDPSEKRIHEWARDHFGTFAGYAQQYLFHHARQHPESCN